MTTTTRPNGETGKGRLLLADGAATATRPAGPCSICRRGIWRGDRYAVLTATGQLAHLPCIASAAGTDTRRAA